MHPLRESYGLALPPDAGHRGRMAGRTKQTPELTASERERFLKAFDEFVPRIPTRSRKDIDAEIAEIRRARRSGGRRTPVDRPRQSG